MFDVGFSELMLIALVALVVIGPERLPRVARTAGHLLGRLQRYVSDVKADINREMQLDELKNVQQQIVDSARDLQGSVSAQLNSLEGELNESVAALDADLDAGPSAAPAEKVSAGETAPESLALADAPADAPAEEPSPQLELGFGPAHDTSRQG